MLSPLNSLPSPTQLNRASLYGERPGLDTMDPSMVESVGRSNGQTSNAQVPHDPGSHQPYASPFSGSSHAHCETGKADHSFQTVSRGLNSSSNTAEFACHRLQICSCGAPVVCNDFGPIEFSQINTIPQNTSSHISRAKFHNEKSAAESIDVTASPSLGPFEPKEKSPMHADFQPIAENPIYNIGEKKIYDRKQKAIPKGYEARWQVIRPIVSDRVRNRLMHGRFAMRLTKFRAPAIIELMSAGTNKEDAKPAVMVVVPNYVKKMQHFLDNDTAVQHCCNPKDATSVELPVYACDGSVTLIGMLTPSLQNNAEVAANTDSECSADDDEFLNSADDSDSSAGLCSMVGVPEFDIQLVSVVREPSDIDGDVKHGMRIRLSTKDGSRYVRGTCGGLLHLIIPNQPPRRVGLIAGHLLEQLGHGSKDENHDTNDSDSTIGDILYPQSSRGIPRHDWALFDAAKLGLELELINQVSSTIAQESELPDVNTVVVIRTSRGEITGTLSSSASEIMLNPDKGFVEVRTVMLDKGSRVTDGDSGAWVFQEGYGKIYGYVIATNGNGHAYMVVLHEAITEMRITLGASTVSLATSTDPGSHLRPGTTHGHVPDDFWSRVMTPPKSQPHSAQGYATGSLQDSDAESDFDRANTLMALYDIRNKLRKQDNTSLARAREKIDTMIAKQKAAVDKKGKKDKKDKRAGDTSEAREPHFSKAEHDGLHENVERD